jgi:L-fuculose-phosphate aldolase
MKRRELQREVVEACRRMSETRLVTGTAGNVSVRATESEVLISPSGLGYEEMREEDVAIVDLEGQHLQGPYAPSVETLMHTGIYKARSEVHAIVHTHARYSTTLACLAWEIPPVHYMLAALSEEGRVPLAPYATHGTEELAGYASEALNGAHSACLLQNHGTITVGSSMEEAYHRTETLEEMAEIYYRARTLGEPVLLNQSQIAQTRKKLAKYGPSGSL